MKFKIGQVVVHAQLGRGVVTGSQGRGSVVRFMRLASGAPDARDVREWCEAEETRAQGLFAFQPGQPVRARDLEVAS